MYHGFVHPGISVGPSGGEGGGGGGGGWETEFPRELRPPDRKVGGTEFPVTPDIIAPALSYILNINAKNLNYSLY